MKSAPRPSSPSKARPWALITVLPFVAAAVVIAVVHFSVCARLPEPLATHFGGVDGQADGFTSARGFLTLTLTLLLVFGTVFGLLVRLPEPSEGTPWLIAGGYSLAAAIGLFTCGTLFANAGATDASAVRLPLWELAVTLAVALLAGALGRLLAGPAPRPSGRAAGEGPRLDLPAGTSAGWSRAISSPPIVALGILLLGAGLLVLALADWPASIGLLIGALAVLPFAAARVTVDRRGLTVTSTLLPPPLRIRHLPLDRITEATSRPIAVFREFGGWGYRIRAGGSGLVLRSGEGMVVRLTNGKEFVVTVDDAVTAVALLNTYLDRARSRKEGA
ncbi:DUF1648 domain-containing protein [Streptomyces sp. DSM 41527]|uniref:DUF1648 domain-containing protein n=1 Tax=Streptomyces mooreae TaxID=3075523 RepID=A0ABU2T921_9ACTN|nr:DUF1648 domain-containing protein [Streptomyces sp. DSM 41527]MDT0457431.1 DUF1648 domain-containing protein [Streptomyces sp. DSM 41527]